MRRLSITNLAVSALLMSQALAPAAQAAAQPEPSGAGAERPERQRTFAEPLVAVGVPLPGLPPSTGVSGPKAEGYSSAHPAPSGSRG